MTAPGGTGLAFEFDGPLPTAVTWSGEVSGQVVYDYDNRFQVASVAVEGQAVSYGYDDDGLLTSAGAMSIQREAASGLLNGTTLGSVATEVEHNAFGELAGETVAVSGSTLYDVSYQRDELGRIVARTETVGGVNHTRTYAYDAAGRLIEETLDGATLWSGSYDANGNRLTSNGVSASYDARDRLVSHGDITFEYTDDGRLKSKTGPEGTTDYDYDVLGNLLGVTLPDGTEIEYVVDGLNRRIGKKVDGQLVQGFLYEDQLRPVAEVDGNGNVEARFVYGTRANVPDYMIKDGTTYRIVADQVGSVRLVVETSTGEVVQAITYDAWGNVLEDTNPGFQPFGFAGGIQDRDTGLVRFGARDYDSMVGRWTTSDALGLIAGLSSNKYDYVRSDPVSLTDSNGLSIGFVLGQARRIFFGAGAQEAAVAGKAADAFLGGYSVGGKEVLDPSAGSALSIGLNSYAAYGGLEGVGLSVAIAKTGAGLGPAALALGIAGASGVAIGSGLYDLYTDVTGSTLGGDFYDQWHDPIDPTAPNDASVPADAQSQRRATQGAPGGYNSRC